MRLLLDTHVLIWSLGFTDKISASVRGYIADPGNECYVSAASLWEIGIKTQTGKIELPGDIGAAVRANRFGLLNIAAPHVEIAVALPPLHKDPFDRMLVAQALTENLTLVTNDRHIRQYNVNILTAS